MIGWVVAYVDDFATVVAEPVSDLVKDAIAKAWRITDKPTVPFGGGKDGGIPVGRYHCVAGRLAAQSTHVLQ